MQDYLVVGNQTFVSSRRLAKQIGYTNDHISRLCRQGKVPGKLVSRTWYVDQDKLLDYLKADGREWKVKKLETGKPVSVVSEVLENKGEELEKVTPIETPVSIIEEKVVVSSFPQKTSQREARMFTERARRFALFGIILFLVSGTQTLSSSHDAREKFYGAFRDAQKTFVQSVNKFATIQYKNPALVVESGQTPVFDSFPEYARFQLDETSLTTYLTISVLFDEFGNNVSSGITRGKNFFGSLFNKNTFVLAPEKEQEIVIPDISIEIPVVETETPAPVTPVVTPQRSVVERIVERVIEKPIYVTSESGVSEETLIARLSELNNTLRSELYRITDRLAFNTSGNYQAISITNRIDKLPSGVEIPGGVVVGGLSGLSDGDIPDSITASNYFPLSGGTITGALTGTDATFSGTLGVSGASTFSGGVTVPYINSTSTTASYFLGNVGIGTTSPYAALSVVGEVVAAHFTGTTSATSSFGGNISVLGTGTSTFAGPLHVTTTSATTTFDGGISVGTCIRFSDGTCLSTGSASGGGDGNFQWFNGSGVRLATTSNQVVIGGSATSSLAKLEVVGDSYFSGNLGLGTTSPYAKLSVVGQAVAEYFTATSSTATSTFANAVVIGTTTTNILGGFDAPLFVGSYGGDTGAVIYGNSFFRSPNNQNSIGLIFENYGGDTEYASFAADANSLRFDVGVSEQLVLSNTSSGNVGIGTSTPYAKLSVVGQAVAEYFTATSTSATSTFPNILLTALSIGSDYITDFVGTGLSLSGSTLQSTLGTSVDLASEVTGTLPVANGGTGATTLNDLITLGTHSSGDYVATIAGTANQITVSGSGGETAAVTLSLPTQLLLTQASTTQLSVLDTISVGRTATTTISQTAINIPTGSTYQINGTDVLSGTTLGSGVTGSSLTSVGALNSGSITSGFGAIDIGTDTLAAGNTTITGTLTTTGNVGIGTSTPYAKLSVVGEVVASHFTATSSATSTFAGEIVGATHLFLPAQISQPTIHFFTNDYDTGFYSDQDGYIYAVGNSADVFSIKPDGNFYLNESLQFDDGGSASIPKINWAETSDENTGIFRPAADTLGFSTGGTERLTINSSGNVGIGTTSPYAKLSVAGEVVGEYFTATSTSATSTFANAVYIGTTTPFSPYGTLQVGAGPYSNGYSLMTSGDIRFEEQSSGGGINFEFISSDDATQYLELNANNTGSRINTQGATLTFDIENPSATSPAFVIDTTKNIGLGTSSPYAKLSVVGQAVAEYFTATSTSATSTFPNILLTALSIGSDYITDFVGTGLSLSGSTLQSTLGTSVDLASEVTGTLPVLNGGTGATTLNDLITLGTHSSGDYIATIAGTANQITVSGSGGETAAVTLSLPTQLLLTQASTTQLSVLDTISVGRTATTTISQTAINLPTGSTYQINGTDVLSGTTLGSGVTGSSLTSVGALNSGSITSGFGAIDIGTDTLAAGNTTITGTLSASSLSTLSGGLLVNAASSTITNLNLVNATATEFVATNATSTNFFATLVRATSALFTSATTTNFYTTVLGLNSEYLTDITGNQLVITGGSLGISEGSGSGLDADTLDTIDSLSFLRSDTTDSYTSGTLTFDAGTTLDLNTTSLSIADTDISFDGASTNFNATGNLTVNTDDLVVIKSTGNIGIGTTSPYAKLSVVGQVVASHFMGTTTSASTFGGNVGIGTTSPYAKLSITATGGAITNLFSIASSSNQDFITVDYRGAVTQRTRTDPTLVGSVDIGSRAQGVYVSGKYAYIAAFGGGFKIVDISNPAIPVVVATLSTSGVPYDDVHVSGKYAYIGTLGGNLDIIDVSNQSSPLSVGTVSIGTLPFGVYVSGKYAYLADSVTGEFFIIDVSNSVSPISVGSISTGVAAYDVYVSGKYAYVANGSAGLRVIDISNPISPVIVGTYDTSGTATEVYVSGRYAYVADGASGLQIVDVSNPASPTLASAYDTTGSANSVYVSGKYAYVAGGTSGIQIIDVASSTSPSFVGSYPTFTSNSVYVSGKYAYIGDQNGLYIFDIGGIETPALYAGNVETNALNVTENIISGNDIYAQNGITAGGGIFSRGGIFSFVASTTQTNPVSAAFMGGNVGVGTTSPYAKLSVAGGVVASHFVGTSTTASTFGGNVGIGTSTPYAKLSVVGQTVSEYFTATSTTAINTFPNLTATNATTTSFGINSETFTDLTGTGLQNTGGVLTLNATGDWTGTLDSIEGASFLRSDTTDSYTSGTLTFDAGTTLDLNTTSLSIADTDIAFDGASTNFNATGNLTVNTDDLVVIKSTGNIGIGTTSPYAKLSVVGQIVGEYFTGTSTTASAFGGAISSTNASATSTFAGGLTIDTNGFVYDFTTNRVGLGTTSPYARLSVVGGVVGEYFTATSTTGTSTFMGIALIGTTTNATSSHKLTVVGNISNLASTYANPYVVGATTTGTAPYAVYVSGRYAYVVNNDGASFQIIDISNPGLPVVISTTSTGGAVRSLNVSGRYAYVLRGNGTLQVIDISNPTTPSIIGTLATLGTSSVYVSGRYAYVIGSDGADARIQVIDVSNPSAPSLVGGTVFLASTGGATYSVHVSGRYAYAITDSPTEALYIIDVSNPSAPVAVGNVTTGTDPRSVYVSGRYAYVTNTGGTVQVIDISNPSSPSVVGSVSMTAPYGIYVSGRYAYVTSQADTLRIIDVSNPATPSIVGSVTTGISPLSVYVSGRYAYVVNAGSNSLQVIDIGGIETTSAIAHSFEAGNAQVRKDLIVDGNGSFESLNVGVGGTFSRGPLSVFIASTTQTLPVSASFMGGNVGIGTTSPYAKLSVVGEVVASYFTGTTTATSTFGGNLAINGTGTTTSAGGFNISAGCFAINGVCVGGAGGGAFTSAGGYTTLDTATDFVGLGTSTPYAKLSVVGQTVSEYFTATSTTAINTFPNLTATNATTTSFGINSETFTDLTGTGLQNTAGVLTLNATGDWTGTLDSIEGASFLRSDTSDSYTSGTLTFDAGTTLDLNTTSLSIADTDIAFDGASTNFNATGNLTVNTDDLVVIKSTGNVGIGTSTPDTTFNVVESGALRSWASTAATVALFERSSSAGAGSYLSLVSGNTGLARIQFGDTDSEAQGLVEYDNNGNDLSLWTSGTEKLTVTSAGNVGIGTTTPNTKLTVTSASANGINLDADTGDATRSGRLFFSTGTGGQAGVIRNAGGDLLFGTNGTVGSDSGTERLRITAAGNVGIGTSTPNALLNLYNPGEAQLNIQSSGNGNLAGIYFTRESSAGTNKGAGWIATQGDTSTTNSFLAFGAGDNTTFGNNERLRIVSGGNIGIGTTSPYAKLSVAGQIVGEYFTATSSSATSTIAGGLVLSGLNCSGLTNSGALTVNASGEVICSPDDGGAGGSPAGSDGQIQYNDGSAFGGTAQLYYDDVNGFLGVGTSTPYARLSVAGNISLDANRIDFGSTTASSLNLNFLASATTTLLSSDTYAFTIATTTTGSPIFRVDTTGNGNIILGNTTGDVLIGDVGSAANLVFEESSTIHGQGGNTLTFGTAGDQINFAVNLGIGTTSPYAPLSVVGQAVASYFTGTTTTASTFGGNVVSAGILSSTAASATSTITGGLTVDTNSLTVLFSSNRVGIGTTTPLAKLEIVETSAGGTADSIYLTNGSSATSSASRLNFRTDAVVGATTTGAITSTLTQNFLTGKGELAFATLNSGTLTEAMKIDSSGRVGIGNSNPVSLLELGLDGTGNSNYLTIGKGFDSSSGIQWSRSGVLDASIYVDNSEDLIFAIDQTSDTTDDHFRFLSNGSEIVRFQDGGNVGIGTTSPSTKLAVSGATNPTIRLANTAESSHLDILQGTNSYIRGSNSLYLGANGGDNISILSNGNVGIGTTSPYAPLSVVGSIVSSGVTAISPTGNTLGSMRAAGSGASAERGILLLADNGVNTVVLSANSSDSPSYFNTGGAVGIGTTTPVSTLSVQGSLCVRDTGTCGTTAGTIYATTATISDIDLAENYPTLDQTLSAGEIVSFDTASSTNVKRAVKGDVITGIISTAPGVLLGKEIPNSKPVALSGRVPVKVNNEGGIISIGDRIALSNVSGVGRRSTTTEETVGIALESFSGTTGEIEVFVELRHHINGDQFAIDGFGNVGIGLGTSTPAYKLHVGGDIGATAFINTSTRDAKKDITYLDTEDKETLVEKISSIKVAEYHYKSESSEAALRMGLIAEEAPTEVLSPDGKGIDLYKLTTLVLMGVQDLNVRFDALEARVSSLESAVSGGVSSGTGGTGLTVGEVVNYLQTLGVNIIESVASFASVITSNLTVGSAENPTGITLFDEATNEPHCLKVVNGFPTAVPGECAPITQNNQQETTGSTTPPQTGGALDTEAPVITIQGNNPAEINVGQSYGDLGAIVTDNISAGIGYKVYVNNVLQAEGNTQVDTSVAGTHEIRYEAVDGAGNLSTAFRTVNIIDPFAITSPEDASSEGGIVIETLGEETL